MGPVRPQAGRRGPGRLFVCEPTAGHRRPVNRRPATIAAHHTRETEMSWQTPDGDPPPNSAAQPPDAAAPEPDAETARFPVAETPRPSPSSRRPRPNPSLRPRLTAPPLTPDAPAAGRHHLGRTGRLDRAGRRRSGDPTRRWTGRPMVGAGRGRRGHAGRLDCRRRGHRPRLPPRRRLLHRRPAPRRAGA